MRKSRSKAPMPDTQDIIRGIINVNYAGEFGAIRLYSGQLLIAQVFHPEMTKIIRTIRHDEKRHCALFLEMMPSYGLRPCRLTWIWAVAGFLLGITTPLLGKRAMLTTIKVAEDTAHEHLGAQILYLQSHDAGLAEIITEVQREEQRHVTISKNELGNATASRYETFIYNTVYTLCQATMWIVTRGASSKLRQSLEHFMVS